MKQLVLLLLFAAFATDSSAQGAKKVFGSTSIVWYGIDLSNMKMIGFAEESPHKIRDQYFKPWCAVQLEVDLAKTFQKTAVYKDMNFLNGQNATRETESLVTGEVTELVPDVIAEMVKKIPLGQKKEGLGVCFVVENFNEAAALATIHAVFFDVATKDVLWSKKLTGKASGKSIIPTWQAAIKDVFAKIEKKEFDAWRKEAKY